MQHADSTTNSLLEQEYIQITTNKPDIPGNKHDKNTSICTTDITPNPVNTSLSTGSETCLSPRVSQPSLNPFPTVNKQELCNLKIS